MYINKNNERLFKIIYTHQADGNIISQNKSTKFNVFLVLVFLTTSRLYIASTGYQYIFEKLNECGGRERHVLHEK
jgi:hypothetical protein